MRPRVLTLLAASAAIAGLAPIATAQAAPSPTGMQARNAAVCPTPPNAVSARCYAVIHELVDSSGRVVPNATGGPSGYGPSDLQGAYALTTDSASAGGGRTVAIVDAYDDPNAASDLATYRHQFGLPSLVTCSVSTGKVTSPGGPCFAKVNQNGVAGSYPNTNGGWAQEESLDVDMVSAICPNCNILLVEASSASFTNLGTAVNTAANLGAVAISNSYGSSGDASDSSYGSYYNHAGIAVTASTGDNGYGVGYPATSDYTVAVGGTSLRTASNTRGWSETAWSGAGSGCSTYQSEPTWQANYGITACGTKRGIADVSAVADPNTGVAVYDSYSYQGMSGWLVFGGTSVSSPIIASVYALTGATWSGNPASVPYGAAGQLNDVTSGSNGSCSPSLLCNAGTGWDGPTGLGTPNGLGAFGGTSGGGGGGGTSTPAAPTNLTAVAGDGSVSLSWTASSGAASYNVYRSLTSNMSSPTVTSVGSATSWTDNAVTNGTTYYYEVTAVNSAGESTPSNQASATPTAATTLSMTVSNIAYAWSSNHKTLLDTVTVSSASGPVANATVSVTVSNGTTTYSGSGTTGTNGAVTFRINHPAKGTYSTTVTGVTATGYQWDGGYPPNSITV